MSLDRNAAERIYKVMAYLAGVDDVDPKEAKILGRFATAHGIGPGEASALAVAGQQKANLEPAQGPAEQAAMIASMIEVVAADDTLDHTEQERLLTLAEGLALPADTMRAKLLERLMGG
jgi:uncharacterized tellurite resistance protein B-like protein